MSDKDTKETTKEEAKTGGPQGFADMCRQMMSGKPPDCCGTATQETASDQTPGCCGQEAQGKESGQTPGCCGPEMQGMMARMMGAFQPKQAK